MHFVRTGITLPQVARFAQGRPSVPQVQGLVSALTARGASLGASVLTVPLLLRGLGVDGYGVYVLVTGIAALLPFADLGLGMNLVSALSQARARRDWTQARMHVTNAFALLALVAAVLSFSLLATWESVNWGSVFGGAPEGMTRVAVLTFGLTYAAGIPLGLTQRMLVGVGLSHLANYWVAAASIGNLCATVTLIEIDAPLAVIVCVPAAIPAAFNTVTLGWLLRRHAELRPNFNRQSFRQMPDHFRHGSWFAVVAAADALNFAVDPYIISRYFGLSEVSTFSIVVKLFAQPGLLLSLALLSLWSGLGAAWAIGDVEHIRKKLRTGTLGATAVSVALLVPLTLFSSPLVSIWTGNSITPPKALVAACAAWALIVAAQTPLMMFMNGAGFARFRAKTSVLMATSNVCLGLALTPFIGIIGPIVASIISNVICVLIPTCLYAKRLLGSAAMAPHREERQS